MLEHNCFIIMFFDFMCTKIVLVKLKLQNRNQSTFSFDSILIKFIINYCNRQTLWKTNK